MCKTICWIESVKSRYLNIEIPEHRNTRVKNLEIINQPFPDGFIFIAQCPNNTHFPYPLRRKEVVTYKVLVVRRRSYFWSFIAHGRGRIMVQAFSSDHVVAGTISICIWIGVGGFVKLDEERKRGRNDPEVEEVDKKKARRRAGNRARVEFALTRPVPASGVVARLVARRVNSRNWRQSRNASRRIAERIYAWAKDLQRLRVTYSPRWKCAKECLFSKLECNGSG